MQQSRQRDVQFPQRVVVARNEHASDSERRSPARHGQNERTLVLERKNYLFMGSPAGGKAAAIAYTLIETAKLNGLDPQAWLADVLLRIPEHPSNRIDELLPWHCKPDKALSEAA